MTELEKLREYAGECGKVFEAFQRYDDAQEAAAVASDEYEAGRIDHDAYDAAYTASALAMGLLRDAIVTALSKNTQRPASGGAHQVDASVGATGVHQPPPGLTPGASAVNGAAGSTPAMASSWMCRVCRRQSDAADACPHCGAARAVVLGVVNEANERSIKALRLVRPFFKDGSGERIAIDAAIAASAPANAAVHSQGSEP